MMLEIVYEWSSMDDLHQDRVNEFLSGHEFGRNISPDEIIVAILLDKSNEIIVRPDLEKRMQHPKMRPETVEHLVKQKRNIGLTLKFKHVEPNTVIYEWSTFDDLELSTINSKLQKHDLMIDDQYAIRKSILSGKFEIKVGDKITRFIWSSKSI